MTNPNHADSATIVSISTAIVSIANFQPVVTMLASDVAIISGSLAIRYYWKATQNIQK